MPRTPPSGTPRASGTAAGPARPGGAHPATRRACRPSRRCGTPAVEGLSRRPTKTSTSSSLASAAWTASSGWCSSVTRVPPERQAAAQRAGHAAQAAALADGDVAPAQGAGGVAQARAGPDGGDQLGLVVAALEPQQLAGGWPPRRCRRRGGRRCAGTRRARATSGRRRCRPPGRCRSPGCTAAAAGRRRRRPAASGCGGRGSGRPAGNRPRPGRSTSGGPQMPSTRRPRRCWKASTAARVPAPKTPVGVEERAAAEDGRSGRCWMSDDRRRPVARRQVQRAGTALQVGRDLLEQLALALAPTITRSAGSPSLNRISVGMLITSNRRVTSRLSSMLSLAISILPACSVGDLLQHRGDHLARAAPLRPEVHQHGDVRSLDMLVKA